MSETIARYYDESKNPESGQLPGVPLADITEERWATLPEWLQASIDALSCYRKTPLPRETAPLKAPAKE